jgi:hypothetical protein
LNTEEFEKSFHYLDFDIAKIKGMQLKTLIKILEVALIPQFTGSVQFEVNTLDFNVVNRLMERKKFIKALGDNDTSDMMNSSVDGSIALGDLDTFEDQLIE